MTDLEQIDQAHKLRTMQQTPGYLILAKHIENEIHDSLERFIALSPELMTEFRAFEYKAQYKVLKDLKDWLFAQIERGDQSENFIRQEKERENATTR